MHAHLLLLFIPYFLIGIIGIFITYYIWNWVKNAADYSAGTYYNKLVGNAYNIPNPDDKALIAAYILFLWPLALIMCVWVYMQWIMKNLAKSSANKFIVKKHNIQQIANDLEKEGVIPNGKKDDYLQLAIRVYNKTK